MSYTIPTIKHDATGVEITTDDGLLPTTGTRYETARVVADLVSTSITRYESGHGWSSQSIHLSDVPSPEAKIVERDDGAQYLVVSLGEHKNLFIPMSIAAAITDAIVNEEVRV